jgi:hypothetical protein
MKNLSFPSVCNEKKFFYRGKIHQIIDITYNRIKYVNFFGNAIYFLVNLRRIDNFESPAKPCVKQRRQTAGLNVNNPQ